MADKAINDLIQALQITNEDLFVLEQSGTAKKLKGAQLVKYAQDSVGEQVTAATEAAESAETAKTGAESAQTQAQSARDAILNMIVEAITLESGLPATVEKSLVDSVYKLTFGLPKGEKGAKGDTNAVAFTVTLSASGWSGKTQTVSDARFLTGGYAYSVAPDSGSFAAYGESVIYADNVMTDGQMQFHCSETPAGDLIVNILRMEVGA